MSSPTPETNQTSVWVARFLGRKTDENKVLAHAENRGTSGRTSLDRFKKRVVETLRLGIFLEALVVASTIGGALIHHHTVRFDNWFWSYQLVMLIGAFNNFRMLAVRRLHDVGVSGEWLWRPISAYRLLQQPSVGPNEWGEGPDIIAPSEK